jgi:hypothetical protein
MLLAFGYTAPWICSEHLGHKELIRRLNKIQRKAARFVKNHYEQTQLIKGLGGEPLENWRLHARLRQLENFRSNLFQSDVVDICWCCSLYPDLTKAAKLERYIAKEENTWTFHTQKAITTNIELHIIITPTVNSFLTLIPPLTRPYSYHTGAVTPPATCLYTAYGVDVKIPWIWKWHHNKWDLLKR